MPSVTPTAAPTPLPLHDCRGGCTLAAGTSIAITGGTAALSIQFPTYFTLSFEVMGLGLAASSSTRKNIINIYYPNTYNSKLKVSATETRELEFSYNGALVVEYGSLLDAAYQSTYTTVVVTVKPLEITTTTSSDYDVVNSYTVPADAFDSSLVYTLFASGAGMLSSLGTLRNIVITRKFLLLVSLLFPPLVLLLCGKILWYLTLCEILTLLFLL